MLKILNFVSVFFLSPPQKKMRKYWKVYSLLCWGDILFINPREKRDHFTPAHLGFYRFQDMFTIDGKDANQGINK